MVRAQDPEGLDRLRDPARRRAMVSGGTLWLTLSLALSVLGQEDGGGDLAAALGPTFQRRCFACHAGEEAEAGLDLSSFDPTDLEMVSEILLRVRSREMPPPDEVSPLEVVLEEDELRHFTASLIAVLAKGPADPGRPTLRRLNRAEYGSTVRDLLGIDVAVARDLPEDATSEGFDNQGDVLFVDPELAQILARSTDRVLEVLLVDPAALERLGLGSDPSFEEAFAAWLERAFRRPPTTDELQARMALWRESGLHAVLSSVLLSPHFLFRVEEDREEESPWPVSSWELASRLSYFLWGTMPDEALFERARDGSLLDPEVLDRELTRLLDHPRARALGERFAVRWLGVAQVATQAVDVRRFSGVSDALKRSMVEETVLFFEDLVRRDASLLELLDSKHTFLNAALAAHYGVEGVKGERMRRVELSDRRRGGVLTQGSVLTATSQPLRTSPVVRGAWVLDRLLASPPPPPPPNAGVLPPDDRQEDGLNLRQRLERHRADAVCASCHDRIDPIGFALEHYDGVGRWRDADHLGPIDARATLPDGREVDGVIGLKDALLARPGDLGRAVTEALLVYALGRALEPRDALLVEEIVAELRSDGWRARTLVRSVVRSYPFLHRRRAR
jgi:hypothetical protein